MLIEFPRDDRRVVAGIVGDPGAKLGSGLFARGDFRAGETVFTLDWSVAEEDRTEALSWDDVEGEHDVRCTPIAPGWYLTVNRAHPLWFINHSCAGNVAFRDWAMCEDGERLVMAALRDIAAGEPITLDYSFTIGRRDGPSEGEPWRMRCFCGAPTCRGMIVDFTALPHHVQQREAMRRSPFAGSVPAFILEEVPDLVARLQREAPDLHAGFAAALETQRQLAAELAAEYEPDAPYFLA